MFSFGNGSNKKNKKKKQTKNVNAGVHGRQMTLCHLIGHKTLTRKKVGPNKVN